MRNPKLYELMEFTQGKRKLPRKIKKKYFGTKRSKYRERRVFNNLSFDEMLERMNKAEEEMCNQFKNHCVVPKEILEAPFCDNYIGVSSIDFRRPATPYFPNPPIKALSWE